MRDFLASLDLVDHHCHGIVPAQLDRRGFEALFSESHRPNHAGATQFDKPLGVMIRHHCAPVLGLEPGVEPDAYIARRIELGEEANRKLMSATPLQALLIDTGHRSDDILDVDAMATLSGFPAREVVRIEAVAEAAAAQSSSADELLSTFEGMLAERAAGAVGLKSIVAYRASFDIPQDPPSRDAVRTAADAWLRSREAGTAGRLEDPVLLMHFLWCGAEMCRDRKLPLQLHVGFGDQDILMTRCDPTHFTPFIRAVEDWDVPVTLLHCYPFHREAAWMAEVFSNVYYDLGVILAYTGPSALRVMEDAMEVGPFFKQLYSSDAFGLSELYHVGSVQFRLALSAILDGWIARDLISVPEAERIARMIASENANRIYKLDGNGG